MSGAGPQPGEVARSPIGTGGTACSGSANTRAALLSDRGTAESRQREPFPPEQDRPSLACRVLLPILLLSIAGLSAAPLAGFRGGWGYFYREGMESRHLRDLTLSNWTHYIHIGYYKQTNAIRQYAWEHNWSINGPVKQYGKLWDNLQYGDATQLLGGYTAGYLALSCLTALAYLGLWLRCIVLLRRRAQGDRGELEGGTAGVAVVALGGPAAATGGTRKGVSHECLIRPLGPWLWPVALVHTVLLAALVITFYLLMDATTSYQTSHVAPGQTCHVAPAWAWWCAMTAVFAWLAVTVLAAAEAFRQGRARPRNGVVLRSPQPLLPPLPPRPPRYISDHTTPGFSA